MSRGDNFFESIYPQLRSESPRKKLNCVREVTFRRRNAQRDTLLDVAAKSTADSFELSKTKSEQLEDLKKQKQEKRSSSTKILPANLQKYANYIESLKINPPLSEKTRSLALGSFFAFVVWANMSARSAFMYFVVGTLINLSMLLGRNMPQGKFVPGQRRQVGTWSKNAFNTAVAITAMFSISSALGGFAVSCLLPIDFSFRARYDFGRQKRFRTKLMPQIEHDGQSGNNCLFHLFLRGF